MNEISMAGPDISESDIEIVTRMLRSGWYGKDAYSYVEKFEREFAEWHGRKFALMTPNCTSAIHLLLAGLDIKQNDEVIVPDVTWIASAAPIIYQRAKVIFADVNEDTWCLDAKTISERLSQNTRAVIVVNLYGNMPEMKEIEELCAEKGIALIEDAAEAIGSKINNRRAGSFGIASVFSFHRTKTLTTGEGGMLVTDNMELYERCKFLRDHGRAPGTYFNTEVTFKYMPSNLAAALGFAQFIRIDELVEKKRNIWKSYKNYLGDLDGIRFNPEPDHVYNSVWSTVILANSGTGLDRDKIMTGFEKLGLPSRPFFYPLSSLPAFKDQLKYNQASQPISTKLSISGVCLPSALNLGEDQIERVAQSFRQIYARSKRH